MATVKKAAPFFGYFLLAFLVMTGAEILGYGIPSITDGWRAYLGGMLPVLGVMLALSLGFQAIGGVVRKRAQLQRPLMALLGAGVCLAVCGGMILALLAGGWLFLFAVGMLTGADVWQYRGAGDLFVLFVYGVPFAGAVLFYWGSGAGAAFWQYLVDVGSEARAAIAKRRGNAGSAPPVTPDKKGGGYAGLRLVLWGFGAMAAGSMAFAFIADQMFIASIVASLFGLLCLFRAASAGFDALENERISEKGKKRDA